MFCPLKMLRKVVSVSFLFFTIILFYFFVLWWLRKFYSSLYMFYVNKKKKYEKLWLEFIVGCFPSHSCFIMLVVFCESLSFLTCGGVNFNLFFEIYFFFSSNEFKSSFCRINNEGNFTFRCPFLSFFLNWTKQQSR